MIDLEKIRRNKTDEELRDFSIINVDKPTGPTSFSVSDYVGERFGAKKAGHFGTLDPAVSGVLPVALNRACRIMKFFPSKKKYVGIMKVHSDLREDEIKKEIKNFVGKIKQIPPVKSNVKRRERTREVFSLDIKEISGRDVLFESEVEAGTYIRKLVHDIGKNIGGAHMLELRRTKAGIFEEKNSVRVYDLDENCLMPAEIICNVLPCIEINDNRTESFLRGAPIMKGEMRIPEETFCLVSGQKFIGIYVPTGEEKIIARPEFVYN